MIKKLQSNIEIVIPLVVLTLIFVGLSIGLFRSSYFQYNELVHLEEGVVLSTKIAKVLDSIQDERGLTIVALKNHTMFNTKLILQRKNTDKELKNVIFFVHSIKDNFKNKKIKELFKLLFNELDILKVQRELIDQYQLSSEEIIFFYRSLNTNCLNVISEVSKISDLATISQDMLAYTYFLNFKEIVGLERSLGVDILSSLLDTVKIHHFYKLIIEESLYQKLFFKYNIHSLKMYYSQVFDATNREIIQTIKEQICSENSRNLLNVTPKIWFLNMTIKMDKLKIINNYLSSNILEDIAYAFNKVERKIFILIIITLIGFIIFILIITYIFKLIKSKEYQQGLLDKNIISSNTNLKGIITEVSEAFSKVVGYSKEELLGKSHNMIRHEKMPKALFSDMWTHLKADKVWRGEIQNKKKNGQAYWVYAIISPLYDKNYYKIGYSAIRYDITNQKIIEELNNSLEERIRIEVEKNRFQDKKLLEQSRLAQMGEMISMIAHQWRQPLSAISATSGAIELRAKLGKLDNKTAMKLSVKISNYSQHLSATIDDFRNFFQPNKHREYVTYKKLIDSVLNIVESSMLSKNITIKQELLSEENFSTYPNEIKQVILNLIKNAEDVLIERSIKNPVITIKTNYNILSIQDNGGGISIESIDKIFDPYFSTKLEKNGTGLGLYMSKTIIEEHCEGSLEVHNDANGAVFTIIIEPLEK